MPHRLEFNQVAAHATVAHQAVMVAPRADVVTQVRVVLSSFVRAEMQLPGGLGLKR